MAIGRGMLAVGAAAGTALALGRYTVRQSGVRPVRVPLRSLLAREAASSPLAEGCYVDAFSCSVPLALPADAPARALLTEEYIRAFFGSRVFRAERMLLAAAELGRTSEAELAAMRFDGPGADRVAVFVLTERADDVDGLSEALFRWCPGGRTWFGIRSSGAGVELLFGSALLDVPAVPSTIAGRALAATMPLHRAYSCVLLAAAEQLLRARKSTELR
jgi:hypothetical protein